MTDDMNGFIFEEDGVAYFVDGDEDFINVQDNSYIHGRRGNRDVGDDDVQNPDLDVHALFCHFNDKYFGGKLSIVEVKWSPRMTLYATFVLSPIKFSHTHTHTQPPSDVLVSVNTTKVFVLLN